MNVNIQPPRIGPQPWEAVRGKLDQALPFANMRDTPYYRDAVYEQFSKREYQRRYAALREKMREHKLDAVIVPGGPSHWSFGGGMLWLTGHWEWHGSPATWWCHSRVSRRSSTEWAARIPGQSAEKQPELSMTCATVVADASAK